jgi:hypothetical protein
MAAKIGIEPESALADVDRSPQRPNALLVQTCSVLAVGQSRSRASGTFGCLLSPVQGADGYRSPWRSTDKRLVITEPLHAPGSTLHAPC